MKEIKFRAWLKEKEMLVDVLGISFEEKYVRLPIESEPSDEYWWYETAWGFDEVELMQFTGLKDKNGVEIYEGDMLRDSESIVIVKFVDGEFSVDYRTIGGKWRNYGSLFDYLGDYEGEIIGNIYENPELIE